MWNSMNSSLFLAGSSLQVVMGSLYPKWWSMLMKVILTEREITYISVYTKTRNFVKSVDIMLRMHVDSWMDCFDVSMF